MPPKKNPPSDRRGPQPIGDVVGEMMLRQGISRTNVSEPVEKAWAATAGEAAARYTKPGRVRRGVLEVSVANSTMLQELIFQKAELLLGLRRLLPDSNIRDLRFQVAPINE